MNNDNDEGFRARRRGLLMASLGAGLATLTGPLALAKDAYPAKPITLVIPFGAGGPTDAIARTVAQSMSTRLGQTIVIENMPGAGANIGASRVAGSAPDGYTMLLFTTALTVNQKLYARPGYSLASFDAVGMIGGSPLWLFVGEKHPARSLQELVRMMKESPGKLSYGSGGSGTTSHLGVEMFKRRYGVDATHVPYKTSAQIFTDLIAGNLDFSMNPVPGSDQLVRSGRLRALGVAGEQRLSAFPDVPTFTEAGFPAVDVLGWFGLVVPHGVPPEFVATLERALKFAVNDAAVGTTLTAMGASPKEMGKAEFQRYIQSEAGRWGDIVLAAGTKVD